MDRNPYEPPLEVSIAPKQRAMTAVVFLVAVIVLAVLWLFPLVGFHHQYVYGLFGWLCVNGEDPDPNSWLCFYGEEYVPNPCGLAFTISATYCLLLLVSRVVRQTKAGAT